jgi:hypothetical protein
MLGFRDERAVRSGMDAQQADIPMIRAGSQANFVPFLVNTEIANG